MSNLIKVADGFAKDENGHLHILPMKLPEIIRVNSTSKKGEEKKISTVKREFIPIQPLKLTAADFQESPQKGANRQKVVRPVCKELFKVPQRTTRRSFSNYRYSMTKSSSSKLKSTSFKKIGTDKKHEKNNGYGLLDIDEAEKLPKHIKPTRNPVKTVLFQDLETSECEEKTTHRKNENTALKLPIINVTPATNESISELEFLELEKALASAKKSSKISETVSPVTSVCTLLENTQITISGKKNSKKNSTLSDILSVIKEDEQQFHVLKQQFNVFTQQFQNYQQEREKRQHKIIALIESLEEDKENRRSIRISNQSAKPKFVVSPAISKKVDLRKSALNKNLSNNLSTKNQSPRIQKAVDLYNTFRGDCTVLSTPRLDRTPLIDVQDSATRSLSRRIQNQCLLLQDTPRPPT